ncbi:lytic murein transglycosylase B [Ferrimonas marina]|uniref:Membrane-bound lytic murein transglycosylase B n=1 Tax=Ferrimonas marina TaxID=299255 RepID=A0A1M5W0D2_9GAMM|nr:lytic murein transglycosylase B [Ferrimonas marina]SHH80890.1 membrane-bound lytic murein transglycosylase B [Ferrimonas marina]
MKKRIIRWAAPLLLGALASVQASEQEQAFVAQWQQQGLSESYLNQALELAKKDQAVLDAIQRPWEAKPWYQYYPIFLTEKRLAAGLAYWQEHQALFDQAYEEFGVEPEIILAILGVETFYGTYMGKYPVLNALYTLGFHYPPRQSFFRKEFGHFLQLAQEQGWELDKPMGSYAGAMGLGQFIPSSYQAYAVDFDQDGQRDLFDNPADAIGSVANYFARHRWQRGGPVTETVSLKGDAQVDSVLWNGRRLSQDADTMTAAGVQLPQAYEGKLGLVKLEVAEGQFEYQLVHPNFYSITRYNHSPLYAMAVWQFSQQLKQAMADAR